MKPIYILSVLSLAYFIAAPAYAYVGPGPGLSMMGALFTLLGGVFLALAMVVAYPVRLFLKRRKQRKANHSDQTKTDS